MESKEEWMGLALDKAKQSMMAAEVPIGCLFIYENEVIASGNNTVNETRNATRHAEINCIDTVLEYCRERQLDYLDVFKQIDVVVTVEPCIMCAAALHQLQIRSIVYGCPNDRFGGCKSVFAVSTVADAVIDITGNVRADEAMLLLKNFYKGTNPFAPESKVKKKKFDPNAPKYTHLITEEEKQAAEAAEAAKKEAEEGEAKEKDAEETDKEKDAEEADKEKSSEDGGKESAQAEVKEEKVEDKEEKVEKEEKPENV